MRRWPATPTKPWPACANAGASIARITVATTRSGRAGHARGQAPSVTSTTSSDPRPPPCRKACATWALQTLWSNSPKVADTTMFRSLIGWNGSEERPSSVPYRDAALPLRSFHLASDEPADLKSMSRPDFIARARAGRVRAYPDTRIPERPMDDDRGRLCEI
jgi:hypothetical protein